MVAWTDNSRVAFGELSERPSAVPFPRGQRTLS